MAMERKEPQTTNAHHPTTHDNGGSHKAQKNNQSMKLRRLSGRGKALKFLKRFSIFEIMIPQEMGRNAASRKSIHTNKILQSPGSVNPKKASKFRHIENHVVSLPRPRVQKSHPPEKAYHTHLTNLSQGSTSEHRHMSSQQ